MACLILRRSIYPARCCWNLICAQPVRRISSSPSPSAAPAPWLMLEDGGLNNTLYNFYSLADKQVVTVDKKGGKDGTVVGSSHGWLALTKQRRDDLYGLDVLLYDPLTHRHVNLPPLETLGISERKLNQGWGIPKRLILSCSPDEDEDQCRAVMFFGHFLRLAYCFPGRGEAEWIPFGDLYHENDPVNDIFKYSKLPRRYIDMVYSRKKQSLFCRTVHGYFESWDLRDPRSPVMNWKLFDRDMVNYGHARSKRDYADKLIALAWNLVFAERSDRLFAVVRHVHIHESPEGKYDFSFPYQTVGFDVHEIIVADDGDPAAKKGELRYMNGNLDGMAFFIGSRGHAFVIEEMVDDDNNNDGVVEPNSIYFTDPIPPTPPPSYKEIASGGHDIGIFDYEKKTFSPCYYPRDLQSVRRMMNPTPTWFTPSSSSLSYA